MADEPQDPIGDALQNLPPASTQVGTAGQNPTDRLARIAKMIDEKAKGLTWEKIAELNGYADRANPRRVVVNALRERVDESVATYRAIEHVRYEQAVAALWPKVLKGDTDAIRTWVRVSEGLRRLHGLDAPVKVELSAGVAAMLGEALDELQEAVLGDVAGEVIDRVDDEPGEAGPAADAG